MSEKWTPTREDLEIIEELLEERASLSTISQALGITRKTLYSARYREPLLSQFSQITQRLKRKRLKGIKRDLQEIRGNALRGAKLLTDVYTYEDEKVVTKPLFDSFGQPILDDEGEQKTADEVTVIQKRVMPNAGMVQFALKHLIPETFGDMDDEDDEEEERVIEFRSVEHRSDDDIQAIIDEVEAEKND